MAVLQPMQTAPAWAPIAQQTAPAARACLQLLPHAPHVTHPPPCAGDPASSWWVHRRRGHLRPEARAPGVCHLFCGAANVHHGGCAGHPPPRCAPVLAICGAHTRPVYPPRASLPDGQPTVCLGAGGGYVEITGSIARCGQGVVTPSNSPTSMPSPSGTASPKANYFRDVETQYVGHACKAAPTPSPTDLLSASRTLHRLTARIPWCGLVPACMPAGAPPRSRRVPSPSSAAPWALTARCTTRCWSLSVAVRTPHGLPPKLEARPRMPSCQHSCCGCQFGLLPVMGVLGCCVCVCVLQSCLLDATNTGGFILLRSSVEAFLRKCIESYPGGDSDNPFGSQSNSPS